MRRAFLGLALLMCGCAGGPGKSSSTSSGSPDRGPEPIYAGAANADCWRNLADARGAVSDDAVRGSAFLVPTEGQTLPPEPATTFAWNMPLATGPAPDAGSAVTGAVAWVFIHVPGKGDVSVLTTEATYTPDAATWARIQPVGAQELTAEIITAYVIQNAVTQGPFRYPGVRRFRIQ